MSFAEEYELKLHGLNQAHLASTAPIERFRCEIDFARQFAEIFPDNKEEWHKLILEAIDLVGNAISRKGAVNLDNVVRKAEQVLEPIGKVAKQYTIHCCGHAHIDMNWMWPWQETVNVTHDTFLTVDKLMDEFPEFRFSQSQASVYIAMEQYCPEVFRLIKKRIRQGKWDVTASTWVEGDKNIVSGEALCRHLLYTRGYFKEKFGLEPEDVKIDWSPDTFGHARTIPAIISRGAVTRYYFCRTGPGPWLFKWKSPDGSEVLAYNDKGGYNGSIDPKAMYRLFCWYVKETGLKDFMFMYGIGDHGGGPTRADLRKFREISKWPIFPKVKLSRTDDFYSAVEKADLKLPVIDRDLNFTFEGCYTSQSRIKRANRISEIALPESEVVALIAGFATGMAYPQDQLVKCWRYTLFNHFHDILPGSGIHATYDYSEGLFQEIQATTGAIRTRALRALAERVDTSSAAQCKITPFGGGLGDGLGAGAGDPSIPGGVTARNAGALCAEPVLVYNQKPWPRTDIVYAKVWNKELVDDRVVVRDSSGNEIKGQVVQRGDYWGHSFATVAFQAEVPSLGYKVYAIDCAAEPVSAGGAKIDRFIPDGTETMIAEINDRGVMENEYLRVEVDSASGAIAHLIDKQTGFDYVPEELLMGVLEYYQEVPHGMSAWVIGQVKEVEPLIDGGALTITQRGPNRVAVRCDRKLRESTISVEIGLNAGSRLIDFTLRTRWVERGSPETGVPMLRVAFPVNLKNGTATYEIPFGWQVRPQSEQEVPALKWADVSDDEHGLTLVNNCKYGHSCNDGVLRLTLIRSSYEPDPLPEIADHEIRYGIIPHEGKCDVVAAMRAGEEFNSPMAVVSAPVQSGELPPEKSFVEVLTPNIFISAIKKAEDSNALVVRVFEVAGKETDAEIRLEGLVNPGSKAFETDLLERPLGRNTAKMEGDILRVKVPAYGIATVRIER
ncbi:MAG: alpha-mannosidase [Armatimonadota bacterium]